MLQAGSVLLSIKTQAQFCFLVSGSRLILGNNHVFRFNFPDQGRKRILTRRLQTCGHSPNKVVVNVLLLMCINISSPAREERIRQSRGNLLEDINGMVFIFGLYSHFAVCLFSYRSQMTSKCGKNKKVAHEAQASVSLMFLPHFDVFFDQKLNRHTAK